MLDLSRIECLGDALRDATVAYQPNVALLEADRHRENDRYEYRRLRSEGERIGALLQARGLLPGDRCAILMSNQSKWIVSALGAFWSGAVLVPLDYKLTPDEQLALLAHARPKALVVEHPVWQELVAHDASVLAGFDVLVTEAPARAALRTARRWELASEALFHYAGRRRDDLACIVYSSGTGGTPKGCMLTHENYLAQAHVLGRMFPMAEGDRYFSILPTNHAIDFMCGMILPLLFGAAVVHQRTLRAEFLAPTMCHYGVTHMALVPRILQALRDKIEEQIDALPGWKRDLLDALVTVNELVTMKRPSHALSRTLLKPLHDRFGGRLKLLFAGGAFVETELASFFYRLGFPVVIGYGLTEACTVLSVNDLKPFRADTVGRPIAGVEIELRDVDADGVGEVVARGPTVMRGYLDAPELTAETLVDGWLRTGDLGRLDAAGHVRLLGRAKNMIVTSGGKNVYPEDVEVGFARVACEELCVLAERYVWPARSLTGEKLVLVVRPRKNQAHSALFAELGERNRALAEHKRVSAWLLWDDEFPRTASQKVRREALAAAIREKMSADALREAS